MGIHSKLKEAREEYLDKMMMNMGLRLSYSLLPGDMMETGVYGTVRCAPC